MPYLGNTPSNQAYAPLIDYFSGNGSATVFTLSRPVASASGIIVIVNNVPQNPYDAYGVSGNTLTFTSAPSTGTNNIWVEYTSLVTTLIAPSPSTVGISQLSATGTANGSTFLSGNNTWQTITIPTVTPASVSDANNTATGYFSVPIGTTAQRPASPADGAMRYNTNISVLESYANGSWQALTSSSYSATYLIVGGGGSGGQYVAGGGGAGGVLTGTVTLDASTTYTVSIGAGAALNTTYGAAGTNGSNSSFYASTLSPITTLGGGGGGSNGGQATSGASGGGGADPDTYPTAGSGTSGQGYAGGNGCASGNNDNYQSGGGGGGAGQTGFVGVNNGNGGQGGNGAVSTITGSSVYYAGGGGGGTGTLSAGTGGAGGLGGGGAGAKTASSNATSGTVNTGGGGGGSPTVNPSGGTNYGGAGGSGVIILSYAAAAQRGTGGTVTSYTSANVTYWVHTFTSSSTYSA